MTTLTIETLRRTLANGNDMTRAEMEFFLHQSFIGLLTQANKIEVLTLQNNKGISSDELVYATEYLQQTKESYNSIDVCGTGGSGLPRINTSTLMSFVLASLGIPVSKHGNRASSGRFGSFDLLENLGITITLSPEQSTAVLKKTHLGFFFAPKCFPQMGSFGLARKALGRPTMFNLLGPLLSPLPLVGQVIGTSSVMNARLLRETVQKLGHVHTSILVGDKGLDEVTLTGKTRVFPVNGEEYDLIPEDFGVDSVDFDEIAGGTPEKNTVFAKCFLNGEDIDSPKANLIHVNVAFVLQMLGKEKNLITGVQMSKDVLRSGKVKSLWHQMQTETKAFTSP